MVGTRASVNYWPETRCAKAFWSQRELAPYQELLRDTADWLEPRPGDRWLDLGCGSGQLTRLLWTKSHGALAQVVGIDVAAVNAQAFEKIRDTVSPRPDPAAIEFIAADFSQGLPQWRDGTFDGAVSGLALQYAESFDEATGQWTRRGYERILSEVQRLLKPGGTFVFSVNVPEPSWGTVAWQALTGTSRVKNPLRFLKKALRIYRYGNWLKREARRGRFHYLPQEEILAMLDAAGFADIETKRSFAGQAFLFRCAKRLRAA